MLMEVILFSVGALLVLGGGVKLKNTLDDKAMVEGDEFFKYDVLFRKYGTQYGVKWSWLKAIAMNESSLGRAKSVKRGLEEPSDIEGSKSYDGKSWGLMQMTIPTARDYDPSATPERLNDPDYSVKLAARFVRSLQYAFETIDPRFEEWVIKSYNQGQGNTQKERNGTISGYAQTYWERYQRNMRLIEERQGLV